MANKCFLNGLCGKAAPSRAKLPIEDPVLAPFVEVIVRDGHDDVVASAFSFIFGVQDKITVGNGKFNSLSGQQSNVAVVKSFQCGGSNGAGCTIEVIDPEGGDFKNIFEKISRGGTAGYYFVRVRFGWLPTECGVSGIGAMVTGDGNPQKQPKAGESSQQLSYVLREMKIDYSSNVISFSMICTDEIETMYAMKVPGVIGTDAEPVTLKQALQTLFKDSAAPPLNVEFIKFTDVTTKTTFRFLVKDSGNIDVQEGRKGKWEGRNRTVLECVFDWCKTSLCDDGKDGKGFYYVYDNVVNPNAGNSYPTLYIMPGVNPQCEAQFQLDKRFIGTYVVNGGNCLQGKSTVLTEDGWKRIEWIVKNKYSGKVLSYNSNELPVWSKITSWYKTPLGERTFWKVRLHNNRERSGSKSGAILTNDHPILTNEGYIRVDELKSHIHKIHSGTRMPSKEIREMVIGTLLGDSHIRRYSHSFQCVHSAHQMEYCNHKSNLLGATFAPKGKNYESKLVASPYWRMLRKKFYPFGKKIITSEILEDFSIISLAYLFMDDGSIHRTKDTWSAQIATCGFTSEDVDLLIEKIKSLGIVGYRRPNSRWPRIFFGAEATKKLSEAISSFIHPSLRYKILPEHRSVEWNPLKYGEEPFYDTFDVIPYEKYNFPTRATYCIGVEDNENFLTHSGIVHNCSNVINFTPNIKWLSSPAYKSGGTVSSTGPSTVNSKGPAPCLANAAQSPHIYTQNNDSNKRALGFSVQQVLTRNEILGGLQSAMRESYNQMYMHSLASMVWNSIEAELKVQGDPTFSRPIYYMFCTVGVVVINPFQVNSSCKWETSINPCNEILTNNWIVTGVSHEIRDGSFTTTLKLLLLAPGVDAPLTAKV